MASRQPAGSAKMQIREASAETIARYTAPRPQGMAKPRPPPFGTDSSTPQYPAHRGNSRGQERPITPQQQMFMFGDEDDAPTRRAQPKDALDGFLSSKANPLAQKKAPPSIFGGASGKAITAADAFPDDAPPTPGRQTPGRAPPQQKVAMPMDGSFGRATPLQPTNSRQGRPRGEQTSSQAAHGHAALSMSGSGHFGMSGMGQALPAGMGRRRPSNSSFTLG